MDFIFSDRLSSSASDPQITENFKKIAEAVYALRTSRKSINLKALLESLPAVSRVEIEEADEDSFSDYIIWVFVEAMGSDFCSINPELPVVVVEQKKAEIVESCRINPRVALLLEDFDGNGTLCMDAMYDSHNVKDKKGEPRGTGWNIGNSLRLTPDGDPLNW